MPTPSESFLTNGARALVEISKDPTIRLRDVAEKVGITERAAQRIVSELVEAGHVSRTRKGRRNSYEVNSTALADAAANVQRVAAVTAEIAA